MVSELSLLFYEDGDCEKLHIKDTSTYNQDIDISGETLKIVLPGFDMCHVISASSGFFTSLTANSFGLVDYGENCELPDGIYTVEYAICPTDVVTVTYNHLRQCQARKLYTQKLCAVQIGGCNFTRKQEEILDQLRDIKMYLDAAKSYAEFCGSPERGMELHNYAVDKLKRLNVDCNNCGC